ncbi:hypothetical protein [Amphiplicatus metriothermophilus]|uniref:Uncharacterized protein n=1 Tax=Amphiplicatus metriothermophilus TaxID=1519374 RepID=A0A239PZ64_9PROT|nr:hypothetical protein [Amphiplicatus metriothermophilus]MBB5518247.1 hypothetical protein [Amphiplicatus metriothermophilus]SNT75460.1 hypothetical protein SAMN06297382_2751 [Amphiplicatus metriothermophilus]
MTYESNSRRKGLPDYDDFQSRQSDAGKDKEGKFASLTAALLARKGEAEPALEPFAHARVAASTARQMAPGETHALDRKAAPVDRPAARAPAGHAHPAPFATADARSEEPKRFAENCPRERIAKSPKRAAVTFRMSVHDFLRLKLASAELERSSQDIIIDAIEAYLNEQGVERLDDCKCLREAGDICASRSEARVASRGDEPAAE